MILIYVEYFIIIALHAFLESYEHWFRHAFDFSAIDVLVHFSLIVLKKLQRDPFYACAHSKVSLSFACFFTSPFYSVVLKTTAVVP